MTDTLEPGNSDESTCPKRLWVMLTLSDDEALDGEGKLPPGLSFHLSRCEPCRALANRLGALAGDLKSLGKLDPDERLTERANHQLHAALNAGAKLTGRVPVPEDAEVPEDAAWRSTRSVWMRFGRYSAAAAVFIALGLVGFTQLKGPSDPVAHQTDSPATGGLAGRVDDRSKPIPQGPRLVATPGAESIGDAEKEVSELGGERLAEAVGTEPPPARPYRRSGPRSVCRHYSHVEAALCDNPNCVRRAIIFPAPGQRDLGWGRGLFDRQRSAVSNMPGKGANSDD